MNLENIPELMGMQAVRIHYRPWLAAKIGYNFLLLFPIAYKLSQQPKFNPAAVYWALWNIFAKCIMFLSKD